MEEIFKVRPTSRSDYGYYLGIGRQLGRNKPGSDFPPPLLPTTPLMENSAAQQHSEQSAMPEFNIGDFITNGTDGDNNHLDVFADFQQHPHTPSQLNIEQTLQPQNVLGSNNPIRYAAQGQPQALMMAEVLKGRLEQQMKLQQLQQLQNHILQQQIELISGQSSMNDQQKDILFHGLLTPGPSAELRAMVPKDLVSPMMLQQDVYMNDVRSAASITDQMSPNQHDLSMSAPAALAFQMSPPFPLPSPAEPEYDLSPLTSPWLLPVPPQQQLQQHNCNDQSSTEYSQSHPTRQKRAASNSGDDQDGMRKRASTRTHSTGAHGHRSGLSVTSKSPVTASNKGTSFVSSSQDIPSPVDLSMPPPAPPPSGGQQTLSSASSSTSLSATGSTSNSPNIAPVTPASIMNLGNLSTGLAPSYHSASHSAGGSENAQSKRTGKGKNVTKPKVAIVNGVVTRGRRGSIAKPGISPNLKPILPGVASSQTSPLALAPTPGNTSSVFGGAISHDAFPGPRKTSHKAAEQKRRDSLKTSFDELRLLLPPVPLPDDAGDEPPLPGSMPPRGPPKGDADGPNRGVSKLALLRCGNTYIRDLKGKVWRRDREIECLRAEVRRLLEIAGDPGVPGVDLERDVDEGVISVGPVGGYGEDGDEDGE